ncbi:MAG: ribosome recycling factor [Pantoea sp. Brub]|nr:ribosome recycling factor [Pantoea sp. Brub]
MIDDIKNTNNLRMDKCIETFNITINKIRTGRVTPTLLDNIFIKYYGNLVAIRKLCAITVENSNTLKINVFDTELLSIIEKSIRTSNLDLNPYLDGNIIKVQIPKLTKERRIHLIKIVRNEAENIKVSIRNIRRDSNEKIKLLFKNKEITVDIEHRLQNDIQQLTNSYIKKIDFILLKKEKELIEI